MKDKDNIINLEDKARWTSEDTEAENSIRGKINSKTPFNKKSELKSPEIIKLELLRELTNYLIELGRTQPTKTMILDWVDKKKQEINKSYSN